MRLPDSARIRDFVLIRTERNVTFPDRQSRRITEMHLVRQMDDGAFLINESKKPGDPKSTRRFPTGFVALVQDGPNVILDFEESDRRYEAAVDGTTLDSHPRTICELAVMKAGCPDPSLADKTYCVVPAVDQVIETLVANGPLIEYIVVHEFNGIGRSGEISFVFNGREWTHPKTQAWLDAIGRMGFHLSEILESLGLNPDSTRYGTHAIGCMKFTPTAAAKLRKREGWKPEFEEFVCTCGHKKKTSEFERPSIP